MSPRPFDQLSLIFGEASEDLQGVADSRKKHPEVAENQSTLGGEYGVVNGSRTQIGPAISGSAGKGGDLSAAASGAEVRRIEGQQPVDRVFRESDRAGVGSDSPDAGRRLQPAPGGGTVVTSLISND